MLSNAKVISTKKVNEMEFRQLNGLDINYNYVFTKKKLPVIERNWKNAILCFIICMVILITYINLM